MIKEIGHVAICVYSIDAMLEKLKDTVGAVEVERVVMPELGQVSSYVRIGGRGDTLELMEPLGETGVVADFLKKKGEGIHHISLHSDSAETELTALEDRGCRIIGRAQGVGFTHPKTMHGVLFEVVDDTYGSSKE